MTKLFRLATNSWLLAVLIGCSLTSLFLWPVLSHFSTHLTSRADGVFISYTIMWVTRALAEGHSLFAVPIFSPYTNTLAYSQPFFSTALISWPLIRLFSALNQPIRLHNFHVLAGNLVLFLSMYWLGWLTTRKTWTALLGAILFTFGTWHLHYAVHLHTFLLAGLPLSLGGSLQWQKTGQWRWLFLMTGSLLYQTLNDPMSGFYVLTILLTTSMQQTWWQRCRQQWPLLFCLGLLAAGLVAWLYLPSVTVSQMFGYTRSIRDAAHFAHSLNRLLQPDFGLGLGLLLVMSRFKVASRKIPSVNWRISLAILSIGLILMLGPVLKINDKTVKVGSWPIPLPYAGLYYIVPGFKAFRTTSRWIVVAGFGLSILVAQVAAQRRVNRRLQSLIIGGTIVILYLVKPPLPVYAVPTSTPTIYQLLAAQPSATVAEFPLLSWRMAPYNVWENDRLFYQLDHHQPLHNGTSGFTPPDREQAWDELWQSFPSRQSLIWLHEQGVTLLVVHFDQYQTLVDDGYTYQNTPALSPQKLRETLTAYPFLNQIACDTQACIYQLKL